MSSRKNNLTKRIARARRSLRDRAANELKKARKVKRTAKMSAGLAFPN